MAWSRILMHTGTARSSSSLSSSTTIHARLSSALTLCRSRRLRIAANVATGLTRAGGGLQAGLALVAAAGGVAAFVVLALPRLVRIERLRRFRLAGWLGEHSATRGETSKAWLLVSTSWALRALAVYMLLH